MSTVKVAPKVTLTESIASILVQLVNLRLDDKRETKSGLKVPERPYTYGELSSTALIMAESVGVFPAGTTALDKATAIVAARDSLMSHDILGKPIAHADGFVPQLFWGGEVAGENAADPGKRTNVSAYVLSAPPVRKVDERAVLSGRYASPEQAQAARVSRIATVEARKAKMAEGLAKKSAALIAKLNERGFKSGK